MVKTLNIDWLLERSSREERQEAYGRANGDVLDATIDYLKRTPMRGGSTIRREMEAARDSGSEPQSSIA